MRFSLVTAAIIGSVVALPAPQLNGNLDVGHSFTFIELNDN